MSDWFLYVVLAGMIGLMFMNSRKRKKQLAELKASIKVDANVVLHSGITGKVINIDGDRLVIESTPGTKLTVLQGAVRGLDSWSSSPSVTSKTSKTATAPSAKTTAKKTPAKSQASLNKVAPKSTSK